MRDFFEGNRVYGGVTFFFYMVEEGPNIFFSRLQGSAPQWLASLRGAFTVVVSRLVGWTAGASCNVGADTRDKT